MARNKTIEEQIAKGEKELNEQIEKNMSLLTQLTDVDSNISNSRKRIRELEAELAALKESSNDTKPATGSTLLASRWATSEEETEEKGGASAEGEELGSSIEGTVGTPRFDTSVLIV